MLGLMLGILAMVAVPKPLKLVKIPSILTSHPSRIGEAEETPQPRTSRAIIISGVFSDLITLFDLRCVLGKTLRGFFSLPGRFCTVFRYGFHCTLGPK